MAEALAHERAIQTITLGDQPGESLQRSPTGVTTHPRWIQAGCAQKEAQPRKFSVTSGGQPDLEQAVLHHRP